MTVPIHMPGALSEIFGRGATSIKVTGRENLTFAGESRRVSDFRANESGRGQSLFPRLDMKQDLQVKLEGTIGDKVHVQVDHNSAGIGADANRINIYYQGYDDDIVRRIDLGGTNLSLPGSGLVSYAGGGHQGLFGIKSELRLGGMELHVIASKEQADVQTGNFSPSGGTANTVTLTENGFIRDRCFFYEKPDPESVALYKSYGIEPSLLYDETQKGNIRVFVDDQNASTMLNVPSPVSRWPNCPRASAPTRCSAAWNAAPGERRFPVSTAEGHWREVRGGGTGLDSAAGRHARRGRIRQLVLGFYLQRTSSGQQRRHRHRHQRSQPDSGPSDRSCCPRW